MYFGDGELFELSTDTTIMKREIEKWEGKAGFQRYLSWLAEAHTHYEVSVTEVLHKNFTSLLDMTRWSFLKDVFGLHPFESIYSRASRYFRTERLRRVFTFGSMYMGMSPFDAPGTYSLLQYTELAEGIWYPVGGFHAIVAALVRVGKRLGVEYRMSTPVESVITSEDGKTAIGVRLPDGEELFADVIVVNADLVYAYNNLFSSPTNQSSKPSTYAKSLSKREGSCSSISFYWALSEKVEALSTHNIFLADEYKESFDSIFKRQSMPEEPSFYVNVPSRVDPSAAPEGCDTVVVLVPIGHLMNSKIHAGASLENKGSPGPSSGEGLDINSPSDLAQLVAVARTKVLSTISSRTGTDLTPLIKHELLNTPTTWEETFNLDKGSILGLSHSFFNVLAFRPGIVHKSLKGCYFVGASTHPGTGVPIVLAGAKMTTRQILKDYGVVDVVEGVEGKDNTWAAEVNDSGVLQGKGTREIDRHQKRTLGIEELVLALAMALAVIVCAGLVGTLLEVEGGGNGMRFVRQS